MKTYLPKVEYSDRKWHLIDADGLVLGHVAVKVADILRGKDKPTFTPHIDAGDFVVIINADKIRVTGQKETKKFYMTYSGWYSGDKYQSVSEVREKHPERLLMHAVKGMLPHNRLGRSMIKKLKVYAGQDHPHSVQNPELLTIDA
ncbi:MAG: 50S ribosomal protein L13 [Verrucomicrobia bacterium]|nr:50S ribosomal protein L13 [Verrucomicrobiota bacterium]